jgi:hypothetical protein
LIIADTPASIVSLPAKAVRVVLTPESVPVACFFEKTMVFTDFGAGCCRKADCRRDIAAKVF